jgi:hypothetical protein
MRPGSHLTTETVFKSSASVPDSVGFFPGKDEMQLAISVRGRVRQSASVCAVDHGAFPQGLRLRHGCADPFDDFFRSAHGSFPLYMIVITGIGPFIFDADVCMFTLCSKIKNVKLAPCRRWCPPSKVLKDRSQPALRDGCRGEHSNKRIGLQGDCTLWDISSSSA